MGTMQNITDWQDVPVSNENINDWQEVPQMPDYGTRLTKDVANQIKNKVFNPDNPFGMVALPLGIVKDAAQEGIKSAYNSLPQGIQNAVGSAGNAVGSGAQSVASWADTTGIGQGIGNAGLAGKQFIAGHPTFGANIDNMNDILQGGGVVQGIATGVDALAAAKPSPKDLLSLIKDQSSGKPGTAASALPAFNGDAVQKAMNQSYGNALASKKQFYNYMNETAAGQTVDMTNAIQPVKNIISEIQSDPFHPGRPVLGRLNDFVSQYENSPQMPLADAVEMKQDINSYFNPKKFSQGAKSPYFQVGNILDSKIDQAAKVNPQFGFAKQLADQNYVNNVALPFTENSVLKKFWNPEDYYAQRSVDNGLATQLPDVTRQRASVMMNNIQDPVQLDAITRILPQDMALNFRQQLAQHITQGSGASRLQSAGKAVSSAADLAPLSTAKHVLEAIIGKEYTPAQKSLLAASKQPSPILNPSYMMQLYQTPYFRNGQ